MSHVKVLFIRQPHLRTANNYILKIGVTFLFFKSRLKNFCDLFLSIFYEYKNVYINIILRLFYFLFFFSFYLVYVKQCVSSLCLIKIKKFTYITPHLLRGLLTIDNLPPKESHYVRKHTVNYL